VQSEVRNTVTAYTPTTTQPITNYIPTLLTAADNVARFDHNPTTGESLGLLIEEQRTNLVLRAEEFDNASWAKLRATVNSNVTVAPDGTISADALLDTAVSGTHVAIQTITKAASAIIYAASVYLKAGVRTLGELRVSDQAGNGARVTFNLTAGTLGTPVSFGTGFTAGTSTIVSVGNGWYRVVLVATSNSATTLGHEVYIANASANISYAGDGNGIYIWGAQLEAGAFPTSYIPTVASQVTRSADSASITGANFSGWFNNAEGTLYSEFAIAGYSSFNTVFDIATDALNTIQISLNSLSQLRLVVESGTAQANLASASTAITFNTATKYVGAYQVNNFAGSKDGGAVITDTLGNLPVVNQAAIGQRVLSTNRINGTIKKLAFYPARLNNTQLQALTS
jgi:hypothetical protein